MITISAASGSQRRRIDLIHEEPGNPSLQATHRLPPQPTFRFEPAKQRNAGWPDEPSPPPLIPPPAGRWSLDHLDGSSMAQRSASVGGRPAVERRAPHRTAPHRITSHRIALRCSSRPQPVHPGAVDTESHGAQFAPVESALLASTSPHLLSGALATEPVPRADTPLGRACGHCSTSAEAQ